MTQPITPRMPLMARLAQTATAVSDGVWLIYNGDVVTTDVDELGFESIDLVIDLATLQPLAPEIAALEEHVLPVGKWREIAITPDGVRQRLVLLDASADTIGLPMFDAARQIRAALAQGFPWQASIGVVPRDGIAGYERVTAPIVVNGRTFEPGQTRDLYVLRNGIERESSVVLFGADCRTGKIAASAITHRTKDHPVTEPTIKSRLDALAAQLGAKHRPALAVLLADGCTDPEAVTQVTKAEMEAMQAQIADLTAKLAASDAKCTEQAAQLAALAQPEGTPPVVTGATKSGTTAPASLHAAMKTGVRLADGTVLRGLAALNHLRATQPKLPATAAPTK